MKTILALIKPQSDNYQELLAERRANPCTESEQQGTSIQMKDPMFETPYENT